MDDKFHSSPLLMLVSNPYVTEYSYFRVLFNKCDKNRDGFVSINELKRFIECQEEQTIPPEVIKAIHQNFDKNGDALLDFEEFLEMINNPIVKKIFKRLRSRYLKFIVTTPTLPHGILQSSVTKTGLYDEEFTCKKYTVGMIALSAIQIALYYVNLMCANDPPDRGPIHAALAFMPERKYEIWRYVTYIFVHASAMHLFPNVFIQILIGVPLEMVHSWRVIVIYVAGALGGCLAHAAIVPSLQLVGGSGGFYAFFTAHIATVIMNWREMSHPLVHLILFGLMTIFDPVYNYIIVKHMGNVSYITHLGGTVVGLLLGVNILRNLKVTRKENIVWYICLISYVIIMIVFIGLNIVIK